MNIVFKKEDYEKLEEFVDHIEKMAKVKISFEEDFIPNHVLANFEVLLPPLDNTKEIQKLTVDLEHWNKKISNEKFMQNAPRHIVQEAVDKVLKIRKELSILLENK